MTIKLISLNIEGHRHLENRILPFLQSQKPDVVCLQEVFKSDVPLLEKTLDAKGIFVPLAHNPDDLWGLLTLSRIPIRDKGFEYYYGSQDKIPNYSFDKDPNVINRAIAWIKVQYEGEFFQIANTHFTWSFEGVVTGVQEKTFKSLVLILKRFPETVFVGDFNTPRGSKIYSDLGSRYKDNIPSNAVTTIDNNLHRSKKEIQLVVDGVFSSPKYKVKNVSLVGGVSDHMALICQISIDTFWGTVKTKIFLKKERIFFILWKIFRRLKRTLLSP